MMTHPHAQRKIAGCSCSSQVYLTGAIVSHGGRGPLSSWQRKFLQREDPPRSWSPFWVDSFIPEDALRGPIPRSRCEGSCSNLQRPARFLSSDRATDLATKYRRQRLRLSLEDERLNLSWSAGPGLPEQKEEAQGASLCAEISLNSCFCF